MTKLLCFLALLTLTLGGCANNDAPVSEPAKPVSAGHAVFLQHCVMCHSGLGDPPGPNPIILGSSKTDTLATFRSYLRKPDNAMMRPFPPEELSDEDIKQLHAYIIEASKEP